MHKPREFWGSELGFVLASIGSAVGIGNIWRFPYIVGTNGGGAFLLPYILVLFGFGLAFMVLEFSVGRYFQTSIINCLAQIGKRFRWAGVFTVIVAFGVLSYYMVVLGWTLSFVLVMAFNPQMSFDAFSNSLYPVFAFVVVLIMNFLVVRKGISSGIEKLNKIGVTLLLVILVSLTVYSITLEGSSAGIDFYLTPDFDKLGDPSIWTSAFGQAFFSLSVGFGALVAYGSYLASQRSLVKSSALIVVCDSLVSFTAGIMIFSFLFSFGMEPSQGASLVFQIMPSIFNSLELGNLIGVSFFALLLVAGFTSSVSLFQVPASALQDSANFSRNKSVLLIALLCFAVGMPSALSYSSVGLEIFDMPFLDAMDGILGTHALSISAMMFVIVVTWFMNKKPLLSHINLGSSIKIPYWAWDVVKIVLPTVIAIVLVYDIMAGI